MSLASRLRGLFSFRLAPEERLVAEGMALAGNLLPRSVAVADLKVAEGFGDSYSDSDRWTRWEWLIRTHRTATEQVSLLEESARLVKRAERRTLNEERTGRFMSSFSPIAKEGDRLEQLGDALEESKEAWKTLARTIRTVRPRVFLTHAFLKLADTSGVETASLFIGGLVALGAVYMAVFSQAAIGKPASAYWTLNDLMIQGIQVTPIVAVVLIAFEIVFLGIRKVATGVSSYMFHGLLLKHPIGLVVLFFIFMMLVVSCQGHSQGQKAFNDFKEMDKDSGEMATVLDRSVLHNVHLVDTTDRTAIFLRREDLEVTLTASPPGYRETLSCVASHYWRWFDCRAKEGEGYDVLVMDRALVVCHADDGQCQVAGDGPVTDLEGRLTALGDTVAEGFKDLDGSVDGVRGHLVLGFSQVSRQLEDVGGHLVVRFFN